MTPGGHMVLTMIGSDKKAFSTGSNICSIWELLGITLNEMVQVDLIEEKKLDSFNLPYYAAAPEEVTHVIETKGSFDIQGVEVFKVDWDANMDKGNISLRFVKHSRGNYVAMSIRVVVQSMLASHFEEEIMDYLFDLYAIKIEEYLEVEKGEYTNMVISMKKKNSL